MKALVIGGGIGGLSAAIALRRVGIEAVVFEQADALREVGAGLSVWTNAVRALRKLGVADAVLATGSILERFEARTWQGEALTETSFGELGRKLGALNLLIHRAELLRGLAHLIGNFRRATALSRGDQDVASGCIIAARDAFTGTPQKIFLKECPPLNPPLSTMNQLPAANSALTRLRNSRAKVSNAPGRHSSRWMPR